MTQPEPVFSPTPEPVPFVPDPTGGTPIER